MFPKASNSLLQAGTWPPNQDECEPHTSVLPLSSLFTCDVTPLNACDSTCVLHVICLLLGARPSLFVLMEPLFTLPCPAALPKGSVLHVCTTQAPLPSDRLSAEERRDHSGDWPPPSPCAAGVWAAAELLGPWLGWAAFLISHGTQRFQ